MNAYRRLWKATCIGFGALGVAGGVAVLPMAVVITFIVVCVAAGLTVAIEHESRREGVPLHGSGRWVRITAVAFGAWVAVVGLGQILGVGFFLLILVLAAVSPRALRVYGRRRSDEICDCTTSSTAQLCHAWQVSYGVLQRAESPGVRLRIISARQQVLDELERRDPEGFQAWLTSAAGPAGDPHRFIAPQRFEG